MAQLFRLLFTLTLLLCSGLVHSADSTKWLKEDEVEFDIYDLLVDENLVLFESADIYLYQNRVLLPFHAITKMLELNLHYGPDSGVISGRINQQSVQFDLNKDAALLAHSVFALLIDDELYLDKETLQTLIDGKISIETKELTISFSNNFGPFPIEKRIKRANQTFAKPQQKNNNYDFVIDDQYRLYTPPKGRVAISARADKNDEQLNVNLQTYNDLLFHGAHLSLAHNQDNDLTGRFNMRRGQLNPNDKVFGVLNHYAFGDVSASNTLLQTSYSGLGAVFSTADSQYNSYFGKINIEENAPANWQAELYKNGFLLQAGTVDADGRVRFENIDTTYGNNRFEIKLYGPYGEEEIIEREFLVGQKMLQPGKFNVNGGIVDTGQSVFNNTDEPSNLAAFVQSEIGISTSTSLGVSLFVQESHPLRPDESFQEGILTLSQQLPNALLDVNLFAQGEDEYKVDGNLLGSVNRHLRYNLGGYYNDNYLDQNFGTTLGTQSGYRAGVNARFGAFGLAINGNSNLHEYELSGVQQENKFDHVNLSLSSRISRINLNNTLSYDYNSGLADSVKVYNQFALSTPLAERWYLRTAATWQLQKGEDTSSQLDNVNINATWRGETGLYASFNGQYNLDDTYLVNSNVSLRKKRYNLILGASYSSETDWQISAGISFNIDYDYHNGRLNLQSEYSAASSTLDLMTYIDNNQNADFDEYDEPLRGVRFGIKPYWQNIQSNADGMTYLPGLGHNAPIKVYFNTNQTKANNLRPINDNFRFYTHAGGLVATSIPFNYASSIDGIIADNSEQQTGRFVPIEILDQQGNVLKSQLSDVENYFYVEGLWPGKYQVRVNPEFLKERGLVAVPSLQHLTINGSESIVSVKDIEILDSKMMPKEAAQVHNENLARGEFYTVQFGVYAERDYCQMRVEELTAEGVENAFYSLESKFCKVSAGEFQTRQGALESLRSIKRQTRTDAFVTKFASQQTLFAILIDSYTTQLQCQDAPLLESALTTYVKNDNQRCLVYVGDFLSRTLANQALRKLPWAIRKGAKVVEH